MDLKDMMKGQDRTVKSYKGTRIYKEYQEATSTSRRRFSSRRSRGSSKRSSPSSTFRIRSMESRKRRMQPWPVQTT